MESARDIAKGLTQPAARLRKTIPAVYDAYGAMSSAVLADGALSAKLKELVALAIAVTRECDGCIAAHARGAARQGATEAEVAEAMGVVIMMNGGPGTVWGPRALAAWREFAEPGAAGEEPGGAQTIAQSANSGVKSMKIR